MRKSPAIGPQLRPESIRRANEGETIISYGYGEGEPVTVDDLVHRYDHTSPETSDVLGYVPLTASGNSGVISAHDSEVFMPTYSRADVRSRHTNPLALAVSGRLAHIVLPSPSSSGGFNEQQTMLVMSDTWVNGHIYRDAAARLAAQERRYEPLAHIGRAFGLFVAGQDSGGRFRHRDAQRGPVRYELAALMGGGDANPVSYFLDDNVRPIPLGDEYSAGFLGHKLQELEKVFIESNKGAGHVHHLLDGLIDVGAKANIVLADLKMSSPHTFDDFVKKALAGQSAEVKKAFEDFMRPDGRAYDPSAIIVLMKAAAQRALAREGLTGRAAYRKGVARREANIRKEVLEAMLQGHVLGSFSRDEAPDGKNEFSPVRFVAKYLDAFEIDTVTKLAHKLKNEHFQTLYLNRRDIRKHMDGGLFAIQSTAAHYPLYVASALASDKTQATEAFGSLGETFGTHGQHGVSVKDIIASIVDSSNMPLMMEGVLGRITTCFELGDDRLYPHTIVPINLDFAPAALLRGIHDRGLFESAQQGIPPGIYCDDLLRERSHLPQGLLVGSQSRHGHEITTQYWISDGDGVQWVRTPNGGVYADRTKVVRGGGAESGRLGLGRLSGRNGSRYHMRSVERQEFPEGTTVIAGVALKDTVTYVAMPRGVRNSGSATTLAMPNPAFGSQYALPRAITM